MNAHHHNAAKASDSAVAGAGVQASWPCPYPHPKANSARPGPAQQADSFIKFNELDAVCSAAACRQPLQFCPACSASNRSLAKFCRACRQPLAFEEAVAKYQAVHEIDAQKLIKEFRRVELPEIGGRPVNALSSGWGYLLVAAAGWGLGVMANARLQPPRVLCRFEIEAAETITAFHALRHADLPPGFLAVGTRHVYRLDFLPELRCQTIFHLPDPAWIIAGAILTGSVLVARAWHRQSNWSRWIAIDCSTGQVGALPFQQHGAMSAMIVLGESGRVLYHTLAEIVVLDVRTGNEQRAPGPACGLNISVPPQFFARTGEVFLGGMDGALYRSHAAAEPAPPEVFGRGRHELMHMFLNVYDDYLYLLCRDNLVLIDYPTGAALWNSQQHAKTLIHCGHMPPLQWGNYLIFSVRPSGPSNAAERVALFSFSQRSSPLLLHPGVALSPAPVGASAHLIAAQARPEKESGQPTALLLFEL